MPIYTNECSRSSAAAADNAHEKLRCISPGYLQGNCSPDIDELSIDLDNVQRNIILKIRIRRWLTLDRNTYDGGAIKLPQ